MITPLKFEKCSPEFLVRFEKALYRRKLSGIKKAFSAVAEFSGFSGKVSRARARSFFVKLEFIFFYALFLKVRRAYLSTISNPAKKLEDVLMRFIYMIAWRSCNGSLFFHFSIFFKYVLGWLSSLDEPQVVFLALDRFSVNARFLARFIAKKLKQNYRV